MGLGMKARQVTGMKGALCVFVGCINCMARKED
jgi:hypothetical protein